MVQKCSGYAKQRMGPKLMNCCKPEPMGTQGYGKMLKRIQVLEDGRVPAKEARNWRTEGQKRRITRKEYQKLLNKFEVEVFMAPKDIAESCWRKDRGAFPKEECDAMEENFLRSWLREDAREQEERMVEVGNESEEDRGEKRRREGRTKRRLTEERRCEGLVSVEAFGIFVKGEIWSWEDLFG